MGFFYAYNLYEACPEEVPKGEVPKVRVPKNAVLEAKPTGTPRRMLGGSTRPRQLQRATIDAIGVAANAPLIPTPGNGDTGLGAPCLGDAMNEYFALNSTKAALGIPLDNNFIVLDNGIGFSYTTGETE